MLPALSHPLSIESPGNEETPFTLAGHACTIVGSEAAGIREVLVAGRRVLAECCVTNAPCTRYCITPIGVERHLRLGSVSIIEKTVVSPADTAFAIEWLADGDAELTLAVREQSDDVVLQLEDSKNVDRVALRAGEPMQLVASLGTAKNDPSSWIRMHRATAERRTSELLRLDASSSRSSAAVAWAAFRVTQTSSPSFDDVLALIALGDFSRARSLLAELESDDAFLGLVGRFFAASGDDGFVRAHWRRVTAAATGSAHVSREAWQDLAHVAEAIGDSRTASSFKQAARDAAAKTLWPEFANGGAVAGASRWKKLADSCFEDEKGAWPHEPGGSAADLIVGLVYGMLGFEPDAARGRARLRLQLPLSWERISVHNIRMGDARLRLDQEQADDRWRFEISQMEGAFPVRLILEPALPALPSRVLVDGRNAELDLTPFGERIVAPVQIVLDDRRCVEFIA